MKTTDKERIKKTGIKHSRNIRQRTLPDVQRTFHNAAARLAAYARYNNRQDIRALSFLARFVEEQLSEKRRTRWEFAEALEECVGGVYSFWKECPEDEDHARWWTQVNMLVSVDVAGIRKLEKVVSERAARKYIPDYLQRRKEPPVPALNSRGGDA
jgi:hypothetical protein